MCICVSVLIERYKQKSEGEMRKKNNDCYSCVLLYDLEGKIGRTAKTTDIFFPFRYEITICQ